MSLTLALAALPLTATAQPAPDAAPAVPLRLDIRVFDGTTEITGETVVSVFEAGSRANARRVPRAPGGERQITLPSGQYDVQLVHQDEGRVRGVRWTSLRLLVAYAGEHGRHLEVLNMKRGMGALQVRRTGTTAEEGRVSWTATLHPPDGGAPVGSSIAGDGYALFVARPGRYDVQVRTADGQTHWIRDARIHEDLTYVKHW